MQVFDLFFLLLSAPIGAWALAGLQGLPSLRCGSSLSVEKESDFLLSPNQTFSSGFYKVGTNAYCYSIWFTKSANKTVVWMANRDRPVNGKRSRLTLQGNGDLVLTDADGSIIWSTETISNENIEAQLLETGNLVLINQAGAIIWKSFDFPTDTLLPFQPLTKNTTLIAIRSRGTYLSGFYNLKFDDNNVLDLIYNGPLFSSVYSPETDISVFSSGRTPYNSSRVAFLNDYGWFTSSDNLNFNASDYGVGPKRHLTLDYDGILRMYSLDESTELWKISWLPGGVDACLVHRLCGVYGICSYTPLASCTCPRGFNGTDPSDWSKGCSPLFNLTCDPAKSDFMEIHNTDYYGYDLISYGIGITFEACRNACLNDCKCKGFGYALDGLGQCFPKSLLQNGNHMPDTASIMHVKVPKGLMVFQTESEKLQTYDLNCSDVEIVLSGNNSE